MSTRAYALAADINGRFQQAAAAYEAALYSDPDDVESAVNLIVLYWQAASGSSCLPVALSCDFRLHARQRLQKLCTSGANRLAESIQVAFWRSHIAVHGSGRTQATAVYRRLLRDHPAYLEPAFALFWLTGGKEAEPEAMRLLIACSEQPTVRNRYVAAVINSALAKQRCPGAGRRTEQPGQPQPAGGASMRLLLATGLPEMTGFQPP